MQSFDIVKTSKVEPTFRNSSIIGKFDLQPDATTERFVGQLDLPNNWQVGCIVGNSGTGKSTIAKHIYPEKYIFDLKYPENKSIVDAMPESATVEEIVTVFNAVGFSSPPAWLKPYHVLSQGQKMRCDLAMAILQDRDTIVFDEFSSVVDRTIAEVGSFAIQKAIRRTNRQFIAVTCHFDVIPWLLPDWVFDTNDMTFQIMSEKKTA